MLFDLRGRGRRRTIQTIYLGLAILMGGGLIFFGVGGTGVGLFNSDNNNGSGGGGDPTFTKQIEAAQRRTVTQPRNPSAWATLASEHFKNAGVGSNYNEQAQGGQGDYSPSGRAELRKAGQAWKRYLALNPKTTPSGLARSMATAFEQTEQFADAVTALEVLTQAEPQQAAGFQQLALDAYLAKQTKKGDRAAAAALRLTPKSSRAQLKSQLQSAKQQVAQSAAQQQKQSQGTTGLAP